MIHKKYYVIHNELLNQYWNNESKSFTDLENATQYDGGSIENIEQIILNELIPLNLEGYYIIKIIIKLNN